MTFDPDEAGKIFVGGLNWETTQENLEKFFGHFGEIVDCVVMKNNETGQSRGFGFVTFKDPDVISHVLAAGPHVLDGKTIDPKACMKRGQQKVMNMKQMKDNSDSMKIFVGGLPINASEEEIAKGFEKFGKVLDVTIMYDHEKQRPRGFGFLTFESPDAVQNACEEHYISINGKQVECKAAQPRNSRPPPRQQSRAPYPSPTQRQGMAATNQGWYQMYPPGQGANSYGTTAAAGGYPVGYNMYQQVPAAAYNYQGNYGSSYQSYGTVPMAQYGAQATTSYATPSTTTSYSTPPAAAPYSAPTGNQYSTPPAASAAYTASSSTGSYNAGTNNQYNYGVGSDYAGDESHYGPAKSRYPNDNAGYKTSDGQNNNQQMTYHPYTK